jgi:hypothetical protein
MLQDATPNSNNRTAIGVIDRRQNIYWVKAHTLLGLRQQLRQLSDICCNPSRLIAHSASHPPGQIASKNPAGAVLPDRKRSADIIGRCGEYTEGQAAANQGEQHGRFHAVDLLPVDTCSCAVYSDR